MWKTAYKNVLFCSAMWHVHACKCHCVFSWFTWVQTSVFPEGLQQCCPLVRMTFTPGKLAMRPASANALGQRSQLYLTFIQIPAGSGHKCIIGKTLLYIFPTYTFIWEITEKCRANMSLARWLWRGKGSRVQTYKAIRSQLATTLSIWRWSACNFSSHKSLWGEWLRWDLLHLCTMR